MKAVPACVFCQIIAGDLPAFEVFREDEALAFLDRRPLFWGHTLVVPTRHHETLVDLPPDEVGPLFIRAQRLAGLMETELGAVGSFVAMNNRISQSVPHLHIHVVPRNPKDGLRGFFWPRNPYRSDQQAGEFGQLLAAAWAAGR